MTLGEIIKQYRLDHSLSMDAFAAQSGMSKSYISILEKNQHPKTGKPVIPSITVIRQAADGMHVDFNDLIARIDGDVRLSLDPAPAAAPLQLTPLEERIITRYRISPATIQGAVCDILHVSQEDADNAQYSESNNANAG